MSDDKSDGPKSEASDVETRMVTITMRGRMTRKQADALTRTCTRLVDVSIDAGIDLRLEASAPPDTAKGTPDPDGEPCQCPACTLRKVLTDLGANLDGPKSESERAASDARVNVIPERGPWGAS